MYKITFTLFDKERHIIIMSKSSSQAYDEAVIYRSARMSLTNYLITVTTYNFGDLI